MKDLLLDFSRRESLLPKREFIKVFSQILGDWKESHEKQTGCLGYTIREEEDNAILHLSKLEGEFYRKLDQINSSFNHYLSMFRAASKDSEHEKEMLDNLVETCLEYRCVHENLVSTWRRLTAVYFPLIVYNNEAVNA